MFRSTLKRWCAGNFYEDIRNAVFEIAKPADSTPLW